MAIDYTHIQRHQADAPADLTAVAQPPPDADPGHQPARPPTRRKQLRSALVAIDGLAVALAWAVAVDLLPPPRFELLLWAAAVLTSLAVLAWQRLYLSRVSAVRSVETQGLLRAVAVTVALLTVGYEFIFGDPPLRGLLLGGALSFLLLALGRGGFRGWLRRQRRAGHFSRSVILIGANSETVRVERSITEHPEAGFQIVGVVGAREAARGLASRWLGEIDDVDRIVRETGVTGAIVVSSAFGGDDYQRALIRSLMRRDVHVHVSSGLGWIAAQRVRVLPLAHHSLMYLEPATLPLWQRRMKRVADVTIAGLLTVLTAPVVALAALAIKLEDGGPVLFRQERVGRGGRLFLVNKLRTMRVDADKHLGELLGKNQRDDGPLFKLARDPRVTRVGRFLRASSIDELPQLWNVLTRDMSLVGPRPALAHEVEQFDGELRTRTEVPPGITGLWQVEARDNPAFGPYRRLDLFYLENWSLGLDFAILLSTVGVIVGRLLKSPEPAAREDQVVRLD